MTAGQRLGVDLGGTKIEARLLGPDGEDGVGERIDSPQGSYEDTLTTLVELVRRFDARAGSPVRVGLGTPGAISPATGRIKNSNSTWLNGCPLGTDLEVRLGRPVRIANDADCFAVSEATDGAAAGQYLVFGVIVGTGTGGGIAIEGRPWVGPNAISGEWGHNPLPWPRAGELPGPDCYCGRRGCIETFLSGPGLSRDHAERTGVRATSREIVDLAGAGDARARDTLEIYAERMARALASVINILDPGSIVIGGGLSRITYLYERVPQLWTDYVFSDRVDTSLLPPRYGDSSGVRGAAWLWPPD